VPRPGLSVLYILETGILSDRISWRLAEERNARVCVMGFRVSGLHHMYRCECRQRAHVCVCGVHVPVRMSWTSSSWCTPTAKQPLAPKSVPLLPPKCCVANDSTHAMFLLLYACGNRFNACHANVMQMSCQCHANVMPMSCFYFSVHIMLLFLNPCLYFSMHVMFVFRYISDRTRVHGEQLVPGSTRAAVPCSVL